jgi:hypothetical protein
MYIDFKKLDVVNNFEHYANQCCRGIYGLMDLAKELGSRKQSQHIPEETLSAYRKVYAERKAEIEAGFCLFGFDFTNNHDDSLTDEEIMALAPGQVVIYYVREDDGTGYDTDKLLRIGKFKHWCHRDGAIIEDLDGGHEENDVLAVYSGEVSDEEIRRYLKYGPVEM